MLKHLVKHLLLNRQFLLRAASSILVGFTCAVILGGVEFPYLDALFLDLRQVLFQPKLKNSEMVFINVSALKSGRPEMSVDSFIKAIEQLQTSKPTRIVISLSPYELGGNKEELQKLYSFLKKDPRIFLYSPWGEDGRAFLSNELWKTFPRIVVLKKSRDEKVGAKDGRIRRFVISMDGKTFDPDLDHFQKSLGIGLGSLQNYRGSFQLFGATQLYLRFHQEKSIMMVASDEIAKEHTDLTGKILFVGSLDQHSVFTQKSILGRFSFNDSQSMDYVISDATYVINALENLRNLDYVKTPTSDLTVLWVGFFVSLNVFMLFTLAPFSFIFFSVAYPVLFFVLNFSIFAVSGFDLDVSRVLLCGFLIQYLGIPVLLMRYLRRIDVERLNVEKERAADKVKSRFIVKAAKADLGLQIAARVSHDIRSPLMALQVANSFIKGKVSEDLESLIRESTLRIKFIADDILENYRSGKSVNLSIARVAFKEILEELLKSYRILNPEVQFELEAAEDVTTYIPQYSLQRCFSNLINNSIEALENAQGTVLIQVDRNDDQINIRVIDDGCGVPKEVRSKLFQERATFGKKTGTGLGLFQIRKELENYGGKIELQERPKGSCFTITLPDAISRVPFAASSHIMIVESGEEIFSALNASKDKLFIFRREKTVEATLKALQQVDSEIFWTVFVDLSLSSEESGFDLIEMLGSQFFGKIVICSAFSDNLEVQQIANRYGALLVSKDLLHRLELNLKLNKSLRSK